MPPQCLQNIYLTTLNQAAIPALWISRPVFSYAQVTGKAPNASERMRILSREHAKLQLGLHDTKAPLRFPRGFYENLWERRFTFH